MLYADFLLGEIKSMSLVRKECETTAETVTETGRRFVLCLRLDKLSHDTYFGRWTGLA